MVYAHGARTTQARTGARAALIAGSAAACGHEPPPPTSGDGIAAAMSRLDATSGRRSGTGAARGWPWKIESKAICIGGIDWASTRSFLSAFSPAV